MNSKYITNKLRWAVLALVGSIGSASAASAQTAARDQPDDRPDDAPELSVGPDGFIIKSPGFVLKFGGHIQADSRVYVGDEQKNTLLLRRVRPILSGTVLGLVDFLLLPDFGAGQALLFDAYLDAHPFPWLRLRTGKFKPPIGLERLQSDPDLPFGERALTQDLTPQRDIGVQLWGEIGQGLVTYALGVFDGASDSGNFDQDIGASKDLEARLFFQPFKQTTGLGALGVGAAATTGDRNGSAKASSLSGLRTVGQQPLFGYVAPASDPMGTLTVYATGRQSRFNPELNYYYGPVGVLGEIVWSREELKLGSTTATLTNKAWHAGAALVIGGTESYTGATPNAAWDPSAGHYGALEIGARYGAIDFANLAFPDLADPSVSASKAESVGFALNWVLSRMVRVATLFEHTIFDRGAGTKKAVVDRKPENFLLVRTQLNI